MLVFCVLVFSLFLNQCNSQNENPKEMRAVWLTNVDSKVLDSRDAIREAMQFLKDHHFNVVFPVVWNDAKTMYRSQIMDSLFNIPIDPRFAGRDPLAEVIEEAHQRNIKVIPWFEYGFASSYKNNGGHLIEKNPHWAAKDNQGKLLTKNEFEWMNGYHPEVQAFILGLVKEVAANYDVDGVQGDDRLPAQPIEGGYSEYTVSLYKKEHNGEAPPENYRDPVWQRWRGNKLNVFAKRLYQEVKAIKPDIIVSWAPSIYPWCYDEYLQDWPNWIRGGYADVVIPQVYRYDFEAYKKALKSQHPDSVGVSLDDCFMYPGILMKVGDYLMSEEFLLNTVKANRKNGYNGESYFFYEGLRKKDAALAKMLLETYYQEPAELPF